MGQEPTSADVREMKRFEGAFVQWVLPWRESTRPGIVAIALARCLRTVLRLCPPQEQRELLPHLVAFIEGKTQEPGDPSLIWTPDQGRVM